MKNNEIKVLMLILFMISFCGCTGQGQGKAPTISEDQIAQDVAGDGRIMIAEHNEVADCLELLCGEDPHIYIAGLKTLEEFGRVNEGGVTLYQDEKILEFSLIKGTGTVTGCVDGPLVIFQMDLESNAILNKEFVPAPEFPDPEQAKFSGEVLEITDERLTEIGIFFKDLFDTYLQEQEIL